MINYQLFRTYSQYILSYSEPTNILLLLANDTVDNFLYDLRANFKGRFSLSSTKPLVSKIRQNIQKLKVDYIPLSSRSQRQLTFTLVDSDYKEPISTLFVPGKVNDIIIAINDSLTLPALRNSIVYNTILFYKEIVNKYSDNQEELDKLIPHSIYAIVYNTSTSNLVPLMDTSKFDISRIYLTITKLWNSHPRNEEHKNDQTKQVSEKIQKVTKDETISKASETILSITNETPSIVNKHTVSTSVQKALSKFVAPEAQGNVKYWHVLTKDIASTLIKPTQIKLEDVGYNKFIPKQVTKINNHTEFVKTEYKYSDKYIYDFLKAYEKTMGIVITGIDRKPVTKKNEMYPSLLERLTIKFSDKYDKQHIIRILLPIVQDNGTIVINGKNYVVTKQLYILPITFTKKGVARFSSFVTSFIMTKLKTYVKVQAAGYNLPIGILLLLTFGLDKTMSLYDITYSVDNTKSPFPLSKTDYIQVKNFDGLNILQKNILVDIGRLHLNTRELKEGALTEKWYIDLAAKVTGNIDALKHMRYTLFSAVDDYSKKLLVTKGFPTTIDKILKFMHQKVTEGYVTDRNDIRELRLRSYEGIVHVAIDEIRIAIRRYYASRELHNNENAYIKVNERAAVSKLVSSGQIRLLENVNPMEELSQFGQVTYAGYQGLSSSNVPAAIRGMNQTFYGSIDPVATPEGATIGVNQQLSTGAIVATSYGALIPQEKNDKLGSQTLSPTSIATPFLSKNEPTRQVMVFNQAKSIVPLRYPDAPLVRTGIEHVIPQLMRTDTFLVKSPIDGTVIKVQENSVLIKGKNGVLRKIDGGTKVGNSGQFVSTLTILTPVVKPGQHVKTGDAIFSSNSIKHDVMALGKNLVASYLFWKGRTFEDGIVVSEDVVKGMESWHHLADEIFIDVDSTISSINIKKKFSAGEVITEAKSSKLSQLLQEGIINEDNVLIHLNTYKLVSRYDSELLQAKIYVTKQALNKFGRELSPYKSFIIPVDKLQYKGTTLNGILIQLSLKVRISISVGDKITNRHAAKGVITYIEPVDQMPKLPDGRHVQIIINPLSVINRTNVGQLYELYTGEIAYQLQQKVLKLSKDKVKCVSLIQNVLQELDVSGYHNSLITYLMRSNRNQWRKFIDYTTENGFPIFIPPFSEPNYKNLLKAMKVLKIPTRQKVTYPDGSTHSIPVGLLYVYKLEHMAFFKNNARSIGTYNMLTGQPTQGKKHGGGQRVGERDVWALSSYGATDIVKEFFTIDSDDIVGKRQAYNDIVEHGSFSLRDRKQQVSRTRDYTMSYLNAAMIEY